MAVILKIILFYVFFLVLLLLNQNRLMFRPTRDFPLTPDQFDLRPEDIFFTASDGIRLHGWLFQTDPDAPYLLFCHGNAGNICDRLPNVKLLLDIPVNVFIFDYRGYGKSEGSPTEEGVYGDAEAAWDFITKEKGIKAEHIVVYGRSLGGAIAINLALNRPVTALILESTFYSLKELAGKSFPYIFFYPFIPSRFNNAEKIKRIRIPLFIIHGDSDTTVPWRHGKRLFEIANPPKQFWLVKGAHHTDSYEIAPQEYLKRFRDFILTIK